MSKPVPDPRIAPYIAKIEEPGVPYVAQSSALLYQLGNEHGHILVAQLIKDYFAALRRWRKSCKPNT